MMWFVPIVFACVYFCCLCTVSLVKQGMHVLSIIFVKSAFHKIVLLSEEMQVCFASLGIFNVHIHKGQL